MVLKFRYRFEAAHRFLKADSLACMTPHGHSWHATLALRFKGSDLNDAQMTAEFSKLKQDWKVFVDQCLDHSYLHNINDPVAEVLKNTQAQCRLLPFPGDPTTEVIALFIFNKMETCLQNGPFSELFEVAEIYLEETPTNSIACDREFYLKQIPSFKQWTGWWNKTDLMDRGIEQGE